MNNDTYLLSNYLNIYLFVCLFVYLICKLGLNICYIHYYIHPMPVLGFTIFLFKSNLMFVIQKKKKKRKKFTVTQCLWDLSGMKTLKLMAQRKNVKLYNGSFRPKSEII